jgi:hypothetical protein
MNIALIANTRLFAALQDIKRWCVASLSSRQISASNSRLVPTRNATSFVATGAVVARAGSINGNPIMPLRVVRVLESGQPRSSVGRMVISGRMADVCAELDRLAAKEATQV